MNKFKYVFLILSLFFVIFITSCNTNYDISKNSMQRFNYVYIISEKIYIDIDTWVIGDYGTLKFTDKNNNHYCICQGNWLLYENIE